MRRLLVLSLLLTAGTASAQTAYDRAYNWEFGLNATQVESWSSDGLGGSGLDVDSETGWGISGGYNFTNRLAIQGEWTSQSPDYRATYVPDNGDPARTIAHTADVDTLQIKGTFYILARRFTPFVEAGFGWTDIDSNVSAGPPVPGCWWDPWWGYRCTYFYQTYGSRESSYSGAIGVRWDISPTMFIRGSYGIMRIRGTSVRDDDEPNLFQIGFGWKIL